MRLTLLPAAIVLAGAPAAAQVAVTEFLNNPDGADMGREWVELFNFGPRPVLLDGWVLADEDGDSFALPPATLAAGAYLVLVSAGVTGLDAATAKAVFEVEWLSGAASDAVIGMAGVALANGADELVLRDAGGAVVWSLAWSDDETPARATFLTGTQSWSIDVFGSRAAPGVVRDGDDNGLAGFAGYEQNDVTPDPLARASDISLLVALFGDAFANVVVPSVGSPLDGAYRVIPFGDLDHDGAVAAPDVLHLFGAWGACPDPPARCPADLDADGRVSITDLMVLFTHWG